MTASAKIALILVTALLAAAGCRSRGSADDVLLRGGDLKNLTVERFPESPLAAIAHFNTDVPSQVTVTILGQDGEDLSKTVEDFRTDHDIPLLGLYPDFRNTVILRLTTRDGRSTVDSLRITTRPLPRQYRHLSLQADRIGSKPLAPGMYLLLLNREYGGSTEKGMFLVADHFGKIRWVYMGDHWFLGKILPNGNLVVQRSSPLERLQEAYNQCIVYAYAKTGWQFLYRDLYWEMPNTYIPSVMNEQRKNPVRSLPARMAEWLPRTMVNHNALAEIDLFGREVTSWRAAGYSIHHDFIFLPNGNLLALASTLDSDEDLIIEMGKKSHAIEREIRFKEILDANRPMMPRHIHEPDWLHANALYFDGRDSTIVVSARNQSAVVKLTLDSLHIRWILGNHEHWKEPFRRLLLRPVGEPFQWQWGQHAPMHSPKDPRRILVYDNGNMRSYERPLPADSSYSRAVEYEIDDRGMTVRQTWEYGKKFGSQRFTPIVGSARYLSNGNRLICFGALARDLQGRVVRWIEQGPQLGQYRNRSVKSSAVIDETTSDLPAERLLEIRISDRDPDTYAGYLVYRAYHVSFD